MGPAPAAGGEGGGGHAPLEGGLRVLGAVRVHVEHLREGEGQEDLPQLLRVPVEVHPLQGGDVAESHNRGKQGAELEVTAVGFEVCGKVAHPLANARSNMTICILRTYTKKFLISVSFQISFQKKCVSI